MDDIDNDTVAPGSPNVDVNNIIDAVEQSVYAHESQIITAAVDLASQQYNDIIQQYNTAVQERDSLQHQLTQLQSTHAGSLNTPSLCPLSPAHSVTDSTTNELSDTLAVTNARLTEYINENKLYKSKVSEYERLLSIIQVPHSSQSTAPLQRLRDLVKNNELLHTSNIELTERLTQCQTELDAKVIQCDECENDIEQMVKTMEEHEQTINKLTYQCNESNEQLQLSESTCNELQVRIDEYERERVEYLAVSADKHEYERKLADADKRVRDSTSQRIDDYKQFELKKDLLKSTYETETKQLFDELKTSNDRILLLESQNEKLQFELSLNGVTTNASTHNSLTMTSKSNKSISRAALAMQTPSMKNSVVSGDAGQSLIDVNSETRKRLGQLQSALDQQKQLTQSTQLKLKSMERDMKSMKLINDEIPGLKLDITNKQQVITTLNAELSSSKAKCDTLNKEIKLWSVKYESLNKSVKDSEKLSVKIKDELKLNNAKLRGLNTDKAGLQADKLTLERDCTLQKKKIESQSKELEKMKLLEQNKRELQQSCTTLQSKYDSIDKQLTQTQDDLNLCKAQLSDKEIEFNELNDKFKHINGTADNYKSKYESTLKQYNDTNELLQHKSIQFNELQHKSNAGESILLDTQKQLTGKQYEYNTLLQQHKQLTQSHSDVHTQLTQLKQQHHQLTEHSKSLQNELRHDVERTIQQRDTIQQQYNELHQKHSSTTQLLQQSTNESHLLNDEITRLEGELKNAQQQYTNAMNKLRSGESEHGETQNILKSTYEELVTLKSTLKSCEKQLKSLSQQVDNEYKPSIIELTDRCNKYEIDMNKLQSTLSDRISVLTALQYENELIKPELQSTTATLKSTNTMLFETKLSLQRTTDELTQSQQALSSLDNKFTHTLTELNNTKHELSSITEQYNVYKRDSTDIQSKLNKQNDTLTHELQQLAAGNGDLSTQYTTLTNNYNVLQNQHTTTSSTLRQCQSELESTQGIVLDVTQQLHSTTQLKHHVDTELNKLTIEYKSKCATLNARINELDELTDQFTALTNQHTELNKEKHALQHQLATLQEEYTSKCEVLLTTEANLAELQQESAALHQQYNALTQSLADTEQSLQSLINDKNQVHSKLNDMSELYQCKCSEYDTLMETTSANTAALQHDITALKHELFELSGGKQILDDQHQTLNNQYNNVKDELLYTQQQLNDKSAEYDSTMAQLHTVHEQLAVLQGEYTMTRQQLSGADITIEQHNNTIQQLNAELTSAHGTIQEFVHSAAENQQTIDEQITRINQLNNEYEFTVDELKHSQQCVNDKSDEYITLSGEYSELQNKSDQQLLLIQQFNMDVESLQYSIGLLNNQLGNKQNEIDVLTEESIILKQGLADDETTQAQLNQQITELQLSLHGRCNELSEMSEMRHTVEIECSELKNRLDSVQRELVNSTEQCNELSAQLESVNTEYQQYKQSSDDTIQQYVQQYNELSDAKSLLQGQYDTLTNEYAELQQQYTCDRHESDTRIHVLEQAVETSQQTCSDADELVKSLESDISDKNQTIESLNHDIDRLQINLNELNNGLQVLEQSNTQYEATVEQLRCDVLNGVDSNTAYLEQIKQLNNDKQQLTSDYVQLNTQLTELKQQLAIESHKKDRTIKLVNNMTEQHDSLLTEQKSLLTLLGVNSAESAIARISELFTMINTLKQQSDTLAADRDKFEIRYKKFSDNLTKEKHVNKQLSTELQNNKNQSVIQQQDYNKQINELNQRIELKQQLCEDKEREITEIKSLLRGVSKSSGAGVGVGVGTAQTNSGSSRMSIAPALSTVTNNLSRVTRATAGDTVKPVMKSMKDSTDKENL